jgi:hypothetical protein
VEPSRAQGAQEGEDVFAHDDEHFRLGASLLEAAPAQGVIRAAFFRIVAFREDAALDGPLQARGLVFFQGVQVVQAAQKEQVGDLLDDLDGVGDAAGPEGVPDLVDFAFEVAGEHGDVRSGGSEAGLTVKSASSPRGCCVRRYQINSEFWRCGARAQSLGMGRGLPASSMAT